MTELKQTLRILIADDQRVTRDIIRDVLIEEFGAAALDIKTSKRNPRALQLLQDGRFHILFTDDDVGAPKFNLVAEAGEIPGLQDLKIFPIDVCQPKLEPQAQAEKSRAQRTPTVILDHVTRSVRETLEQLNTPTQG